MKKLVLLLLFAAFGVSAAAPDDDFVRGNEMYVAGDYTAAIEAYNKVLTEGFTSHKLLYNLANAHFKNGDLGQAILLYDRALVLKPADRDTRHNLEIARSRVKVRVEPVPQFFPVRGVGAVRDSMGRDCWAVMSLMAFAVVLAAALVWLLAGDKIVRKTGLWVGVAAIMMLVLSLCFALHRPARQAVVMSSAATAKAAPDSSAADAFILYEGMEVLIVSELNSWREVELADGNTGWVAAGVIEEVH